MAEITTTAKMSQRILYLRNDGRLFVQFAKKHYPYLKKLSIGEHYYEHATPAGAVIFGKIVEVTGTGVILDEWEVKAA